MRLYLITLLGFISFLFARYLIGKHNLKKFREKFKKEARLEVYEEERAQIILKVQEDMSGLLQQKTELEQEISVAQEVNISILKNRTEEINIIMSEVEEEKKKVLEEKIRLWSQTREAEIANQLEIFVSDVKLKEQALGAELLVLLKEVEDYREKRSSINEAVLREKKIQEQENFYKVNISQTDREDITILEEIRPRLKNRESLSKLIWEVFIQRASQEMIKRVTNNKDISGIYKITYLKTGESYIGKTTNIKIRWTNHLKTAVGLEGAAHSTLHTRMEKDGFWNYTFEILEEVPKEKLTEREKYYIKLYDTTSQLNMREG